MQVSETSGLVDLQSVTVTATGFPALTQLVVVQCAGGGPATVEQCDRGLVLQVTSDAEGAVATEFTVRRTLYTPRGLHDCAAAPCVVAVSDLAAVAPVSVPVSFDAAVPAVVTQPTPSGSCTAPCQPFGYAHTGPEGGSPQLPIAGLPGDPVPWQSAGAGLRIQVDGTRALFEVTLEGVVRTFTTAPYPVGTNYPNRAQGPADAFGLGSLFIVAGSDGSTFVQYDRANSGDSSRFAWRFDEPCDPPVVAAAAAAPGTGPSFTG